MSLNIEIKATSTDPDRLEKVLRETTRSEPVLLKQHDTFFKVLRGRLKMRCDEKGQSELIYYRRDEQKGPKLSRYFRKSLKDANKKKEELSKLFGIESEVNKTRKVFLVDNARVHLDNVEGVGEFVEIEVVLDSPRQKTRGKRLLQKLMDLLDISEKDLISDAYETLIIRRKKAVKNVDSGLPI